MVRGRGRSCPRIRPAAPAPAPPLRHEPAETRPRSSSRFGREHLDALLAAEAERCAHAEGGDDSEAETGHPQLYLEELAAGSRPAEAEGEQATLRRLTRQARPLLRTSVRRGAPGWKSSSPSGSEGPVPLSYGRPLPPASDSRSMWPGQEARAPTGRAPGPRRPGLGVRRRHSQARPGETPQRDSPRLDQSPPSQPPTPVGRSRTSSTSRPALVPPTQAPTRASQPPWAWSRPSRIASPL